MLVAGVFRIGNEPVVRYTADNEPVLDLSFAYDYGKKGSDGKRPTQWINATFWCKNREKLIPYLSKGKQIFSQLADIHIETYTKKDGNSGTSLKARIVDIQLIGDKSEPQKPAVTTQETNDYPF